MPGIFFRYLTDQNQLDWVDDFNDIQPKTDFEVNWDKDRVDAPTEEQLVDMFIKWIRSTNASHQPKQIPMTSDMGLDLPEPAEDENEIT
tara:strand:+ start:485 stop:751 length:267 start_codon:yes stop_codon:yes gene_type:complete